VIHVYPVGDVAPHAVDGDGSDCWCDPDVEWVDPVTGIPHGEPISVHRSSDGRELVERGEVA